MMGNGKMNMWEIYFLGVVGELVGMFYCWNVIDEYDLVIENGVIGILYYYVMMVLWKIFLLFGVKNFESKMSFYEMVIFGMILVEVVFCIRENESFYEGEV